MMLKRAIAIPLSHDTIIGREVWTSSVHSSHDDYLRVFCDELNISATASGQKCGSLTQISKIAYEVKPQDCMPSVHRSKQNTKTT